MMSRQRSQVLAQFLFRTWLCMICKRFDASTVSYSCMVCNSLTSGGSRGFSRPRCGDWGGAPYEDAEVLPERSKGKRGMTQWEVTPLTKLRKKVRLPKLWPTMPGHVLLVRCATKESATPVIAMRMVSQRVGCMNTWKIDQEMP